MVQNLHEIARYVIPPLTYCSQNVQIVQSIFQNIWQDMVIEKLTSKKMYEV